MTDTVISPDERNARLDGPIHTWFELSYSNYLVLPRSLMQSMPVEWQERMVACVEGMRRAYEHLDHPDAYEVTASVECTYSDLSDNDMRELGISRPDAPDGEHDESWEDRYYDRDGNEHQAWERVLVPRVGGDPIPHYNRGRTFIEPLDCTQV
jgi:hypothetical protein